MNGAPFEWNKSLLPSASDSDSSFKTQIQEAPCLPTNLLWPLHHLSWLAQRTSHQKFNQDSPLPIYQSALFLFTPSHSLPLSVCIFLFLVPNTAHHMAAVSEMFANWIQWCWYGTEPDMGMVRWCPTTQDTPPSSHTFNGEPSPNRFSHFLHCPTPEILWLWENIPLVKVLADGRQSSYSRQTPQKWVALITPSGTYPTHTRMKATTALNFVLNLFFLLSIDLPTHMHHWTIYFIGLHAFKLYINERVSRVVFCYFFYPQYYNGESHPLFSRLCSVCYNTTELFSCW